jgi:hypothetical protein
MLRFFIVVIASTVMVGCAVQQPMYSWGNYDQLLYASYKDPAKANELRVELETQIAAAEQRKQKVPPGLYAELGTLYLQGGDTITAVEFYKKERSAWPESRGVMDALIKGLERRQKPAEGEAAK